MSENIGVHVAMLEAECREIAAPNDAADFEARARAVMKSAQNYWMSGDPDVRFRAAVGVLLVHATEDEKRRITKTMRSLNALSAAMSGVPVDFEAVLNEDTSAEPYPLLVWFQEAKS